jgi:hypothetical protein
MTALLRPLRTFGLLCVIGLTTSVGLPAHAQDQQAENIAAARTLGIQGVQLAEAGKCNEAIEKLARAEALYHAPTILGRLGECQVNVGQIVLGSENLNKVVREQLAPNAPKAFHDAQARAKKALEAALPRISHLTVEIEPTDVDATVTVGGATVPKALIGAERPTDPGSHEVVATAQGYLPAKTNVSLSEGSRHSIKLRLEPDPNAVAAQPAEPAVTPPPAPVTPPPATPPPAAESNKTPSYVLFGVGGVGIIVGSVTGLMAIQKKGELDCPDNECRGSNADKLDSANTTALVSTIGFGVGIASAALGTILLFTGKSEGPGPAPSAKYEPGLRARAFVGLGSVGVAGSF